MTDMKKFFLNVCSYLWPLSLILAACDSRVVDVEPSMPNANAETSGIHALQCNDLQGNPVDMADYDGTVMLVVNVASKCGYTPQYNGLEELHQQYKDRGFTVIGFPCNDFGGQEPGSAGDITQVCRVDYGVTFPMMEKVVSKSGDDQSPIYTQLEAATGELPSWNFGKYLVDRNGQPVAFFGSSVKPMSPELTGRIEALLD